MSPGGSGIRLAVISREGAVLDAFRQLFDACRVELFHAPNVSALYHKLPDTPINGFIIDVPVVVRSTHNEKLLLEGIEAIFPYVRVNWSPQGGFRVLYADITKSGEENLRAFIQGCLSFSPRSLRKSDRKQRNFNVLLWEEGKTRESARRAFTMDISPGGIFVCTCEPPPVGSVLWVVLLELGPSPFKVTVRWHLAWGSSMRIPGFGAHFLDLSEQQKVSLAEALL